MVTRLGPVFFPIHLSAEDTNSRKKISKGSFQKKARNMIDETHYVHNRRISNRILISFFLLN